MGAHRSREAAARAGQRRGFAGQRPRQQEAGVGLLPVLATMSQRTARLGRTMAGRAAELARAQEAAGRARWVGVLAWLGHAHGQEEEGEGEWTLEPAWAAFGDVGRVGTRRGHRLGWMSG